jgi:precorrin-6B methylase 2
MEGQKPSPDALLGMATGFWVTKTLTAATDLKLFSKISRQAISLPDIVKILGIKQRSAKSLLNACVALGLLTKDKGLYSNTSLSQTYLVRGKPHYLGDLIHLLGNTQYQQWGNLKEAVVHNSPVETEVTDPESVLKFIKAMHGLGVIQAEKLAELIDFSGTKTLLDMGGGSSAYSLVLARKYPHLKAVVYDLPEVCDVAQKFIKQWKAESQVSVCKGNLLFDDVPRGFDGVILSQVLHGYGPRDCMNLLKKAFQALNKGGKLIINESLLNDEETGPLLPALFSLNMLVETPQGSSYSGKRIKGWLQRIGYRGVKVQSSGSPLASVTAQKP